MSTYEWILHVSQIHRKFDTEEKMLRYDNPPSCPPTTIFVLIIKNHNFYKHSTSANMTNSNKTSSTHSEENETEDRNLLLKFIDQFNDSVSQLNDQFNDSISTFNTDAMTEREKKNRNIQEWDYSQQRNLQIRSSLRVSDLAQKK